MAGYKPSKRGRQVTIDLNRPRYLELVAAKGWKTQDQQAEALGVAQHTISRVVGGQIRLGPRVLAALINAFPDEDLRNLVQVVEDRPLRRVAA